MGPLFVSYDGKGGTGVAGSLQYAWLAADRLFKVEEGHEDLV